MDDIEFEEDVDNFGCDLDEENENEDEEKEGLKKAEMEEKINDVQNMEESWFINIEKYLDEISESSEKLAKKLNQICKEFDFYKDAKRLDLIKKIIKDAYNHSRINFNQRLNDFCNFLLSEKKLEYDIINQAVNNVNLEEIISSNKDIIYFWKAFIVEKYCNILTDKNNLTDLSKKIIKSLLEENYNLAEIYSILYPFKSFLSNENFTQFEIIESLISIIIAYKINQMDKELIEIINDNTSNDASNLNQKVALEFYLKASDNKNSNPSELSIQELLNSLKNMNSELTDNIIREREEQLILINSIIHTQKYNEYKCEDFQNWARNEMPRLNFENKKNESIAQILGMISLAIKKERGYYLRNSQLLAILMFIEKDKKYGLIEEISTGEGKSCIICSLSIYFALRKKKVDIISSSYSLAKRDSEEFEKIYDYFNLTTNYPKNADPYPYKCDILYGTFLEFEGDCLRELVSDKKIRNNRPYEVIIIDEVDNLFIDNILSSTRLTGSTKGMKFLIPIYLMVYFSFELFDFLFLIFFSLNLRNVEPVKKKKFEKLIKEPEYRKKIIINIIESLFKNLNNNNPDTGDEELNEILIENNDKQFLVSKEKNAKINKKFDEFYPKLEQYMKYPNFLEKLVNFQMPYWLNSAFRAKNYMNKFIDYVVTEKRGRDIAPVDRENTGETELSTVYSDGLHQMLEIKEKLRIKDETLTATFLSHITFFQNYKKNNEFLFFGLTGTIGDNETQKIYKREHFNSKALFIPQYKKKRFIELPPILTDILEHHNKICEDIIINYSYGRKILVICESIKEAQILHQKLLNFDISQLKEKIPFIKEDFKNFILLYTRSDTAESDNYKSKKGRIILSTNIGGRGTDIKTNEEQEKNGGMHVILTSMPSNYRVLKQAFGRTSREGKKGTGQIIIKKEEHESYSEVVKEMNKNENERIENIQKNLKTILFKDKLFIDFCSVIKHIDKDSCLFEDIKERWALFLKTNISKYSVDDFDENEIEKNFKDFKENVEKTVNNDKDYEKYENPFIKIEAGLKKYKKFEKGLNNYLNIKMDNKRFIFVIPYIKAIILIKNQDKYDNKFFDKLKEYLKETQKDIELLIDKSIDPIINSFSQWNELFRDLKLEIIEDMDENENEEDLNNFENIAFQKEDMYKQYYNIKNILEKINRKIDGNLDFIERYIQNYGDSSKYYICPIKKDLVEGLYLSSSEEREIGFFDDASFYFVFDFEAKIKYDFKSFFYKLFLFLLCLVILPLALGCLIIGGIGALAFYSGKALVDKLIIRKKGNLEIENNSLFSNVLIAVIKKFSYEDEMQQRMFLNVENEKEEDDFMVYQSLKKTLKAEIYEVIERDFLILEKLDIVKFLYFIDLYLSNDFWSKKISQIIRTNFKDIFEKEFNKKINFFKRRITTDNYNEIKSLFIILFKSFWSKCIFDIKDLKNKKEYNEETGINSLEHLIKMHNPTEFTEEILDSTFKQIIKYNLISKKGLINEKLFKNCFTQIIHNKVFNLKQNFYINITTNIDNNEKLIELSNLKNFVIKDIKVPNISSYFVDLEKFYKRHDYNIEEQKQKDYTSFIVNNLKDIIQKMLIFDDSIFKIFYRRLLTDTKIQVKKLMDSKFFSQSNIKNVEREISLILNKDEQAEFDKLILKAEDNVKMLKKKK